MKIKTEILVIVIATMTALVVTLLAIIIVTYPSENIMDKGYEVDEVLPYEFSVEDYLKMREDMRYDAQIDSIFMNMSDQILTYILVNKGTHLSIRELVEEYLNNQDKYDNLIKNAMDIQKVYVLDTLQ